MDTWLIFHDPLPLRWEDGVQYAWRIIGFAPVPQERFPGKSGSLPLMAILSGAEIFPVRRREIRQSALPRKFSKHKERGTVPQTDTGSQLEKSKANE